MIFKWDTYVRPSLVVPSLRPMHSEVRYICILKRYFFLVTYADPTKPCSIVFKIFLKANSFKPRSSLQNLHACVQSLLCFLSSVSLSTGLKSTTRICRFQTQKLRLRPTVNSSFINWSTLRKTLLSID